MYSTQEGEIRRVPNHVVGFKEARAVATPESTVPGYMQSASAHTDEFGDPNQSTSEFKDAYAEIFDYNHVVRESLARAIVNSVDTEPESQVGATTQVAGVPRDAQGV